ncbi:hypothetical protein BpHYR1_052600 [Brachionus plicatilis]|uniref:Uncharacterized protein n=1 Tax=Brachionus plicatilis TaxID=10195 RepID=A0A3M7Q3Q5_BRAPC|nr:hypothetical protein BpHYR1_052600 [Brachionus plicatilis]
MSEKIENFIKTGNQPKGLFLKKTNLTVKSALNTEEVKCAVGSAKLKMNEWEGEHEFIFTKLYQNQRYLKYKKYLSLIMDFQNETIIYKFSFPPNKFCGVYH